MLSLEIFRIFQSIFLERQFGVCFLLSLQPVYCGSRTSTSQNVPMQMSFRQSCGMYKFTMLKNDLITNALPAFLKFRNTHRKHLQLSQFSGQLWVAQIGKLQLLNRNSTKDIYLSFSGSFQSRSFSENGRKGFLEECRFYITITLF